MKKILVSTAVILMLMACQNESVETTISTNAVSKRLCAPQDVLQEQLIADPSLAIRMNEIEAFTQKRVSASNFRLSSTGKSLFLL